MQQGSRGQVGHGGLDGVDCCVVAVCVQGRGYIVMEPGRRGDHKDMRLTMKCSTLMILLGNGIDGADELRENGGEREEDLPRMGIGNDVDDGNREMGLLKMMMTGYCMLKTWRQWGCSFCGTIDDEAESGSVRVRRSAAWPRRRWRGVNLQLGRASG